MPCRGDEYYTSYTIKRRSVGVGINMKISQWGMVTVPTGEDTMGKIPKGWVAESDVGNGELIRANVA